MIGSGIHEVKDEQGKVLFGFKFGTHAAAITEKESGISIIALFKRIGNREDTSLSLLQYFYGGAVAYAKKFNLEVPTMDQVAERIDDIGLEKTMAIYLASLAIPKSKNPTPPPVMR